MGNLGFGAIAELPLASQEASGICRFIGQNLTLTDEVHICVEVVASDTIGLVQILAKTLLNVEDLQAGSTIYLSDTATFTLEFNKSIVQTLTLTDEVHRYVSVNVNHTLNIVDVFIDRHLAQQNPEQTLILDDTNLVYNIKGHHIAHDLAINQEWSVDGDDLDLDLSHALNFYQSFSYQFVHSETVEQTLNITDTLSEVLLTQQNVSQDLTLTQDFLMFILRQQNVEQTLTITDIAIVENFVQQNIEQTLTITDTALVENLAQQNVVQALVLTDTATAIAIYLAQDVVQSIIIWDGVSVIRERNVSACDCLDLQDRVYRNVSASAENTLVLTDTIVQDPFVHTIGLTQVIVTNALGGDCCDGYRYYIPDKRISNTLELTDLASVISDGNKSLTQGVTLLQTVAYILVSG
jgi:hypothetical protein